MSIKHVSEFKDFDQIPTWLIDLLQVCVENNIASGYEDGTIRVDQPVTRGEYFAGLAKLLTVINEVSDRDHLNVLRKVANYVVQVDVSGSLGSGVILPGGLVLTNAHVVGDNTSAKISWTSPLRTVKDGPLANCPVIKKNVGVDMALIRIPDKYEGVQLSPEWLDLDGETDKIGATLYVQGSPVGISGQISVNRFSGIKTFWGSMWLTMDGAVNPGNSGGPIFDVNGLLVGIVRAKPSDPSVDGIGLGIPAVLINGFLRS